MLLRIRVTPDGVAALREDHEDIGFRQVELGVLAMTEQFRGLDDLVEDGLESFGARHGAKHIAYRAPLPAQVLVLPKELLSVDRLPLTHATGLYVTGAQPTCRSAEPKNWTLPHDPYGAEVLALGCRS